MKCTVLVENSTISDEFVCEHGFSLYLEYDNLRILFDTGQSELFFDNAQKLGVDLALVDFVVLSHGHYDHGGGLRKFLEINHHASVYMHDDAFGFYMNGTDKYIGLDQSLKHHPQFIQLSDRTCLSSKMSLIPSSSLKFPSFVQSHGLKVMKNGQLMDDSFNHELYLEIVEDNRTVLISGCTHSGLINVMECLCPDVFVGGFHLKKIMDEVQLKHIAAQLTKFNSTYYTGHCTGDLQFLVLKRELNDHLIQLSTGMQFEI